MHCNRYTLFNATVDIFYIRISYQPYNVTNQLPAIYIIGGYVAVIVTPLLIIGFLGICTWYERLTLT